MNPRDLPVLTYLDEVGPADPFFDLLVLLGPCVVALIALLGRTVLTEAVALAYLLAFPAYLAYEAATRE